MSGSRHHPALRGPADSLASRAQPLEQGASRLGLALPTSINNAAEPDPWVIPSLPRPNSSSRVAAATLPMDEVSAVVGQPRLAWRDLSGAAQLLGGSSSSWWVLRLWLLPPLSQQAEQDVSVRAALGLHQAAGRAQDTPELSPEPPCQGTGGQGSSHSRGGTGTTGQAAGLVWAVLTGTGCPPHPGGSES